MSEVKRFDVPSMRSLTQGEQAVMGYEVVLASDYDALAAEAQALREEVAEYEALCNRQAELLSQSIVAIRGPEPELTRWGYADLPLRVKTIVEEAAALRARVVVPREFLERIRSQLDLRAEFDQTYPPETQPVNDDARLFLELRALLSEQE
ncbi:hypothetical protein V2E99_006000 [Pseudomonas aeruginosa]